MEPPQGLDGDGRPSLTPAAASEKVRASGLWNSNHVDEGYEPAFLETLAHWVNQMEAPG